MLMARGCRRILIISNACADDDRLLCNAVKSTPAKSSRTLTAEIQSDQNPIYAKLASSQFIPYHGPSGMLRTPRTTKDYFLFVDHPYRKCRSSRLWEDQLKGATSRVATVEMTHGQCE